MHRGLAIATTGAGWLALAACGGSDVAAESSTEVTRAAKGAELTSAAQHGQPAPEPRKDKKPTVVQVQSSQYGDVLFDGKGFVLYLFTKDGGKSKCYGDCAGAWPPYVKRGPLKASDGVDQSALGKTERKDGSQQVTYHGHPLYYYEHDDDPGEILCHDVFEFGGDWLVVQPDGQPAP